MSSIDSLLASLRASTKGLTLSELLALHPKLARRTAQRWIGQLLAQGSVTGEGQARSRRYHASSKSKKALETFPKEIPLAADSHDVLAYVRLPLRARKPVGYQRELLTAYRPNRTHYLSASLRRQLQKMGRTASVKSAAGTYGRAILNRLLIDLSWASSNLEGNTYSRLDTRELIEHGKAAAGKAAIETQMILNHKSAIELLVENAGTISFDRYSILNVHSALSENLLPNPADEGRLRQHAVEIGNSVYRPLSVAVQIEDLFDVFLEKARSITDAFEQSFFAMVHLPYLQPFADMNKRTSRLIANLPLLRDNLCPLTFLDVPEPAYSSAILGVYELTRIELLRDLYVWAYERSTQEYLAIKQDLAEPDPIRLAHRTAIKRIVHDVVVDKGKDLITTIHRHVVKAIKTADRTAVQALVIEELQRLHEGVLARYALRPAEFNDWKIRQTPTPATNRTRRRRQK